ncbi:MAG: MBL fold metallo-hydrolase [Spirochaetaceae bacterium]|jgi:phosphoribosyl 1,2-cyclic phosphodiesterase|nr:MBL fold metallo-hydrolase [Spirochaetaceae bacterium]
MRIHFWGVRGSLPAPQMPSQIKSKISSVLERLKPSDIESSESKERFLAGLPPWLFGTVGGNTPCVSVNVDKSQGVIIFDSGSGLREMGIAITKEHPKPVHYHVFYSHFHWDHIQGLPFFNPAYDPSVSIDFYSPMENLKTALYGQMTPPYFPAAMESMASKKTFHRITGKVMVNSLEISYKKLNHPGGSYAYAVNDGRHRFIYATDTELSAADFIRQDENTVFFEGADIIALDSQYTLGEAIEKYNWGHSAFSMAVDFAANWGIKHVVLFHHDPTYDDRKLFNILQSARWYTERMGIKNIEISLATEGLELTL